MTSSEGVSFAGESDAYREARLGLLREEQDLRRQLERVAQLRRQLPPGRRVEAGYGFTGWLEGAPVSVPFEDLFKRPDQSLVVYSFMFDGSGAPCPMCTAFLDSLDGVARQLAETLNLAIVAKASIEALEAWRTARGWSQLSLYSEAGCGYSADYFGEAPDGAQLPMLNVFRRTPDGIRHHYATEMLFSTPEPGQHPRHMDLLMPLWNLYDLVPEGRPASGVPRL